MDTSDLFTPYSEEQVRNARAYFENPDPDDERVYEIPHWIGTVEARDRRIAELEALAERQAAAHDDTLDRAEAAESRVARAVAILRQIRESPRGSRMRGALWEDVDAFLAEKESGR